MRMDRKCMIVTIFIGVFILSLTNVIYPHKTAKALSDNKDIKMDMKKYQECLQSQNFTDEKFSEALKNKKRAILELYNTNANFKYEDLKDGYTFGQNIDEALYAASVNKLPLAIYAYHLADENKLDLNKQKTYTSKYYHTGSGVLRYTKFGGVYTLSELLDKLLLYSDNIAYDMLVEEVPLADVKAYWHTKGYDIVYTDKFGNVSPHGMSVYAKEVYNYYLTGSKNAKVLVQNMQQSDELDSVKNKDVPYEIAHKYGFYDVYYNDVSVVFDLNPYSVSITSTMGDTERKKEFFLQTHRLLNEFNHLYWQEKTNLCTAENKPK